MLQRHRWFFLAFTVAGLALRVFFAWQFPQVTPDSQLYADLAKNWLAHGIYGQTGPHGILPTYVRLPGYPAFLAGVFAIFGIDNYRAVFALQILFDLGTCFLLTAAAHRFLKPGCAKGDCRKTDRAAQVAFALAALCPFLANYTAAALTETLEIFATALAFNLALAGLESTGTLSAGTGFRASKGFKVWMGCGAAIGAAILLRPDGGLLAAAIGGYLGFLFLRRRRRQEFLALCVLTFTVAACLLPWTVRNFHTFGRFQPLAPRYANMPEDPVSYGFNRWTKTWIADYVSTQELYWSIPNEPLDFSKLPERAFDDQQQFLTTQQLFDAYNNEHDLSPELDARFEALAEERIQHAPLRYYVRLPLLRMVDMWLRPRTALLPPDPRWWEFNDDPLPSTVAVGFGLLNLAYLLAAALGFARRVTLHTGMLLLFLLLRTMFLGSMENPEERYTLECYPVIILAGAACFRGRGNKIETPRIM
jgi:4-amino-4-deoxy-L-arabinose transferase-like glycosyltransferase